MQKNIVFILCGYLLSLNVYSQSTNIDDILKQVEQNNPALKTLSAYLETKRFELKSGNKLPDPQLGAYYLPLGTHSTGVYTEYQISQSFEFPTVYGTRANLIDQQSAQLELEYREKRQEILTEVKTYCLNLIYLNKRLLAESLRVTQAKKVFQQVQELYEKEQVGILELNKAKVAWMQEQFKVQQVESDKKHILLQLANMNGGIEITFATNQYPEPLNLLSRDSLWQAKLGSDPELIQLKQQEIIAEQALKLTRNETFPNLTAGYNSQGISGERYSGVYAGVSIPLWSNRNKVKSALSQLSFQQSFTNSKTMQVFALFETQYHDYQMLLIKFKEYQATLLGLNSDELLLQAYQLGEISFLEYYMELQFYRQAFDAMLDMQLQLYLSQTELLKHQL